MKVLIRTLPLENANYGGILQNWALQQVLIDMGATPVTDLSVRRTRLTGRVKFIIKTLLLGVRRLLPSDWRVLQGDAERFVNRPVTRFIEQEIQSTHLFTAFSGNASSKIITTMDGFVVGSDQIWRKAYGDVSSYLLDFLPSDLDVPRVAYAASFGSKNVNEWSVSERKVFQNQLRQFSGISVRETSASEWLASELRIESQVLPDPTLLISPHQYVELIERHKSELIRRRSRYLLLYCLDVNTDLKNEALTCARRLGLDFVEIGSEATMGNLQRISVPAWLDLIRNADAVVTDSFHGTVFSAIFDRPFAVVLNETRGVDRFMSFLTAYKLTDHCASDFAGIAECLTVSSHLGGVESNVQVLNESARSFLRESLGLPQGSDLN